MRVESTELWQCQLNVKHMKHNQSLLVALVGIFFETWMELRIGLCSYVSIVRSG